MKKRILSLLLSLSMLLYFSSVAFAIDDTMATNTIKNQLNRDAVFALMQKHNITGGIDQETKNAFFSKLDKLNNLEKEKKLKKESSISIKNEIQSIKSDIANMPVIELSASDLRGIMASPPSVPGNTSRVSFYGMMSYVPVSGVTYQVFEIVAYSNSIPGGTQPVSYPMFARGSVDLLSNGTYTQQQFSNAISLIASVIGNFYNSFSIISYIDNLITFFQSGSTQKIQLDYNAQQTFVYAYVSDGNANFDFMQTTEKVAISETRKAISTYAGIPHTCTSPEISTIKTSNYYANVSRPATRYASYNFQQEAFAVGTPKYYYNGVFKATIPLNYYNSVYNIPGV